MEKEFKQLLRLSNKFYGCGSTSGYLDPECSIEVLDGIELLAGKVMITRVKDFFEQVYQPKFDFTIAVDEVKYNYGDHSVKVTFKSETETHLYDIGLNTTKRKYTCNYFSQSCTIKTMLGKIEKEAYAAAKAAKKVNKPAKEVDVDEIIRFHS